MTDPRYVIAPSLPLAENNYTRTWQDRFLNTLRLYFNSLDAAINSAIKTPKTQLELTDGVTAPPTAEGRAIIYVDAADGDLKIRFSDGTIKTIITDT